MSHFNDISNLQTNIIRQPGYQYVGTSHVVITGSKFHYEPPQGSQYVVYRGSFMQGVNYEGLESSSASSTSLVNYTLQYSDDDSTYSDFLDRKMSVGDSVANQEEFHIISPFFILPTWSGKRYVRLIGRAYSSSTSAELHTNYKWDGTTDANNRSLYYKDVMFSIESIM